MSKEPTDIQSKTSELGVEWRTVSKRLNAFLSDFNGLLFAADHQLRNLTDDEAARVRDEVGLEDLFLDVLAAGETCRNVGVATECEPPAEHTDNILEENRQLRLQLEEARVQRVMIAAALGFKHEEMREPLGLHLD